MRVLLLLRVRDEILWKYFFGSSLKILKVMSLVPLGLVIFCASITIITESSLRLTPNFRVTGGDSAWLSVLQLTGVYLQEPVLESQEPTVHLSVGSQFAAKCEQPV